MATLYTEEELIEKIKKLDEEIEKQISMEEYQLSDGNSNQKIKYRKLDELKKLRMELMYELGEINPDYARTKFFAIRGNPTNRTGLI